MRLTRRGLLRTGAAAAAGLALPGWSRAEVEDALRKPMPTRVLGRTGVRVSMLGLGAACLGHSFQPQEVFDRIVGEALDLGISYIDTAPTYDVSQERLGPIVKRNRERMFLISKTREQTKDGVLRDLERSLRLLQTDHVDLAHLHDVGTFDVERLMDEGSALSGLREAQKRGMVRFLGASGHQRVPRFVPAIETGLIDVVMGPINYFDRHTYRFEERVLPAARKQRCGIAAMKVLGGPPRWSYRNPTPAIVPKERVPDAIRYALSVPDVTLAVVGINFIEQLRQAVAVVKAFQPLSEAESATLAEEGKALAAQWGEHLGAAG